MPGQGRFLWKLAAQVALVVEPSRSQTKRIELGNIFSFQKTRLFRPEYFLVCDARSELFRGKGQGRMDKRGHATMQRAIDNKWVETTTKKCRDSSSSFDIALGTSD